MKRLAFSDPVTSSVTWIWSQDPALDWKTRKDFADDESFQRYHAEIVMPIWGRYNDTNDAKVLPVREGWEPIRWVIGKLSMLQVKAFAQLKDIEEKIARIAYGVRDIQGLQDPDGNTILIDRVEGTYGKCLPDHVLMWIINDPSLREELYWRVVAGGMLSSGQRKSDPVPVLDAQPADPQG